MFYASRRGIVRDVSRVVERVFIEIMVILRRTPEGQHVACRIGGHLQSVRDD